MGRSPWGRKESDTTERLHFHFSLSCIGGGHGNPLLCSCLENPGDGGAWWAAVYGVAQCWTRPKRLSSTAIYIGHTNEATCLCAALYLVFEDILLLTTSKLSAGLPLWLSGKQSTCQCRRHEFKSLSWDDPLEKEMATHSSILAWEIPRSEEPGGLQSKASRKNQTELSD